MQIFDFNLPLFGQILAWTLPHSASTFSSSNDGITQDDAVAL
ncbi:hypothetical protein [Oryzibacter oryziterrae]|nr:hypothetical protein [Oryzibacter oryziterrae]